MERCLERYHHEGREPDGSAVTHEFGRRTKLDFQRPSATVPGCFRSDQHRRSPPPLLRRSDSPQGNGNREPATDPRRSLPQGLPFDRPGHQLLDDTVAQGVFDLSPFGRASIAQSIHQSSLRRISEDSRCRAHPCFQHLSTGGSEWRSRRDDPSRPSTAQGTSRFLIARVRGCGRYRTHPSPDHQRYREIGAAPGGP